jgi:dihydrofolate synthase/folylpolyglutamate synthase
LVTSPAADEPLGWLAQFDHSVIRPGLERIDRLLAALGHPQRQLAAVHLAGTNGKGSTAAMIASILQSAGYRVGLYTSPHLHRLNERMRINGRPIPTARLVELADELRGLLEQLRYKDVCDGGAGERNEASRALPAKAESEPATWPTAMAESKRISPDDNDPPTYFECTTAMAFAYFARERVDWAVIETGLGGRFDATNLVAPRVTVLTPMDYDHMDYLGSSLESIAWEKTGILKPGIPAVVAPQSPMVQAVIDREAARLRVPVIRFGRDYWCDEEGPQRFTYRDGRRCVRHLESPLLGRHQLINSATAVAAVSAMGVAADDGVVASGLAAVRWPGRLEVVRDTPRVLLDGAHNPAAARALAAFLSEEKARRGGRVTAVFGIMRDKAIAEVVSALRPVVDQWIATAPSTPRALPADDVAAVIHAAGGRVMTEPDPPQAVRVALSGLCDADLCCVTGSFYTVAAAREWLLVSAGLDDRHAVAESS